MKLNSVLYITIGYQSYKKKIDGQIAAFAKKGIDVIICYYDSENKKYICKKTSGKDSKVINEIAEKRNTLKLKEINSNLFDTYNPDAIYIRRPGISIILYDSLIMRAVNKGKALIYEIPTYPIDNQNGILHRLCRHLEWTYIKSRIISHAACIPIFARNKDVVLYDNMIKSFNSVNADRFKAVAEIQRKEHSSFEMLAVAFTQKWHGYDRMIRSLELYQGNHTINFTIYGNYTDETLALIQYCKEKQISNVYFIPENDIKNTNDFFAQFDIGVGCLGLHRRNLKNQTDELDTSIKNKEYCAMGLPFIHSSEDEAFPDSFLFHKLVPNDESMIDLDDVISWHNSLHVSLKEKQMMNQYAAQNLGFDKYAENIIRKIHDI